MINGTKMLNSFSLVFWKSWTREFIFMTATPGQGWHHLWLLRHDICAHWLIFVTLLSTCESLNAINPEMSSNLKCNFTRCNYLETNLDGFLEYIILWLSIQRLFTKERIYHSKSIALASFWLINSRLTQLAYNFHANGCNLSENWAIYMCAKCEL